MTASEAIGKYIEKFGYYPYYMLMSAPDDTVIKLVTEALETGKEIDIEAEDGAKY